MTITSSKWIFDKIPQEETHEIKLEEQIEETNLATLICNSTQYIQPKSKCIVEYELKLPESHDLSSKKNPNTFKNKNFSVFIDDNSCNSNDTEKKYKLEPLNSITKFCGKYYSTGIITKAPKQS